MTDSKNACVYVFNKSEKFLFSFGRKGNSRDRGSLSSPTAIAIDSEDYVYISESNVGVSIFDSNGNFMKAFGVCKNSLKNVKAMHIDTRGNLYVCEGRNNHVCIFSGIKTRRNY
jgi:DNA-binding beta-propeller fold protein YncE